MTKRKIPLFGLIIIATIIYIFGIFALGVLSFATGGWTLVGAEPTSGIGAAVNVLASAWVFLFPLVFWIWYLGFYRESRTKKIKTEDDRYTTI